MDLTVKLEQLERELQQTQQLHARALNAVQEAAQRILRLEGAIAVLQELRDGER